MACPPPEGSDGETEQRIRVDGVQLVVERPGEEPKPVKPVRALPLTDPENWIGLMDEKGNFFFMEVNTRLQVEHPVTEMVTGIDIVKEQIRIAAGERLSFKQSEVTFTGHAIECRINAENPDTFVPSPGPLKTFHLPGGPGTRVDTHGYEDYVIPPYYDSLVAKLIVHDRTREQAIARMSRALDFFVVEGIQTSIPLHQRILRDPDFIAGALPFTPWVGGGNGETAVPGSLAVAGGAGPRVYTVGTDARITIDYPAPAPGADPAGQMGLSQPALSSRVG